NYSCEMSDFFQTHFGLSGKRALVTGGARGIGRAIAEGLSAAGADVCVHYFQSEAPAREVVEQLKKTGRDAWCVGGDLREPGPVHSLFEKIRAKWDALDILVNNSGDLIKRSKIEDFPDDLLDDVIDVNYKSAVYVTRAAI